jgi:hypothetical protein
MDAHSNEGWLITSGKGNNMSYLHSREWVNSGKIVSVQCSHQINVLVMDDNNYSKYKRGENATVYGGFYTHFPANIAVPHTAHWNIVLALPPGHRANISHSINILG